MTEPLVSVVLLAHNGARFVGQAVQSILDQSYRNLEIIVIDDGSTDETRAVLARYDDPRMRVLRQPNLWIGFARNRGVAMAKGEYIAAMSHDDISLPQRLERQIATMKKHRLDVCFTWAEIIDRKDQPLKHFLDKVFNQPGRSAREIRRRLKPGNFLLAPSVVCHRRCYHNFASNVVLFGNQDYALWLQMLRRHRAAIIEERLVKYRVHGGNVSLVRFANAYRQLETWAARRLAKAPRFPRAAETRRNLAGQLLMKAGRLVERPDARLEAYLAANRAVNLAPTERAGYEMLATVLMRMGHREPAELVRGVGSRVDAALAYPLPLQRSSEVGWLPWIRGMLLRREAEKGATPAV